MKQQDIAALFHRTADLLELKGDSVFRVRAYQRAAQNLERFTGDLDALAQQGTLRTIPGIGTELAAKIAEYCASGRIAAYETLARSVPSGLVELLEVPGLGPKTVKLLHDRRRIDSLEALEAAARAGKLRGLPGVQAKKEHNILRGIEILRRGRERMHLGVALPLGQDLVRFLLKVPGVSRASTAGSLRRMRETVGDLDVLAASQHPGRAMEAFTHAPFCARILGAGSTKASILTPDGLQVDLRVVTPESYGAALQYFTGSKEHNVHLRELAVRRGLKVNEYGVFRTATNRRVAGREEADVYRALGLPWIPPELREDTGEIDAALAGRLPKLLEASQLRGDFHIHTNWTDGHHTLEEMAAAGAAKGYEYLAICDHSRSLRVANGMSVDRLRQQLRAVRALSRRLRRLTLLTGAEVDILADGSLDYPDSVLRQLDVVVGSVHSHFRQDESTMTKRLIRAMRNPYLTIVGHPTGRLMGQRDPYGVNFDALFRAAKETQTALEINAYPKRLDLGDGPARQAKQLGATLAISTDSHSRDQLDQVVFGVGIARRAWLEPADVLNCRSRVQLLAWIAAKRQRLAPAG